MNTELIKLTKLRTNSENPRTISKEKYEKLINSILVFPKMLEIRPIVVDETFTALGGNQRTEALKDISKMEITTITERLVGLADFARMNDDERNTLIQYWGEWLESKTVPVIKASQLTEEEKRQFIIKDNNSFGSYDWDMLANSWDAELLDDWGVDLPSDWSVPEEEKKEAQEDDFSEEDAANVDTRVKVGEIWQLGEHRLMCGDSTKKEDVERLMGGEKADMVFTDPPYNVDYSAKNKFLNESDKGNRVQRDIVNDSFETDEEVAEKLWKPAFQNLYDNAKDDCSIYVSMPQGGTHMMMMMMMMIHESGWKVKHELIWVKNNHVLGRTDYFYKHEPIMFGWKKTHNFYGKGSFDKSTWEIPKPSKSDLHPTMKPIALIENMLLNSSKDGDIILDCFGGSGSTLIACEQINRKCRMVEYEPYYCDIIIARWEKLTGKEAVKIYG